MTATVTITRLPDFPGVAEDMDALFIPDDCPPNTIVIRRGRLVHDSRGVVECVLAYRRDKGLAGLRLVIREPGGEWLLAAGMCGPGTDQATIDAIADVIGCACP